MLFNGHRLATAVRVLAGKRVVIFCHGFGGTKDGPSGGLFIDLARALAKAGVSSLRFDQYGSGASEGRFEDSSFADWVATTRAIGDHYLQQDYRVALLGHSMGGGAAIAAAVADKRLAGLAAWVPDPVTTAPTADPDDEFMEEDEKRVRWRYWHEAHAADVATALSRINIPIAECGRGLNYRERPRSLFCSRKHADRFRHRRRYAEDPSRSGSGAAPTTGRTASRCWRRRRRSVAGLGRRSRRRAASAPGRSRAPARDVRLVALP